MIFDKVIFYWLNQNLCTVRFVIVELNSIVEDFIIVYLYVDNLIFADNNSKMIAKSSKMTKYNEVIIPKVIMFAFVPN